MLLAPDVLHLELFYYLAVSAFSSFFASIKKLTWRKKEFFLSTWVHQTALP